MKKNLLAIVCILLINAIHAQTATGTTATHSDTLDTVQVQATFPGGAAGWTNYLQHHLRAEVGAENLKVKRHQTVRQTAIISFLVDKAGKISEVTITNPTEVHPKLAEEAMRVIKKGPDWIPATINGKPVIYRQKQAITFAVSAE